MSYSFETIGKMVNVKSQLALQLKGLKLKLIRYSLKWSQIDPLLATFTKKNSFVTYPMVCYYGNKVPKVKSY